jgi:hypothetical protein
MAAAIPPMRAGTATATGKAFALVGSADGAADADAVTSWVTTCCRLKRSSAGVGRVADRSETARGPLTGMVMVERCCGQREDRGDCESE